MNIWERLEGNVTDVVARFSPWLSPLPTAYLTGRATILHLNWPMPLGVAAGLVVEFLGLSAINSALELYNYNRNKRKSDPRAPMWIAVILIVVYFGAVTVLTVLLDTVPEWSPLAPLVFPLLSMAGMSVLALRADHRRRLDKIASDRSERRSGDRSGHRSVTGQGAGDVTGLTGQIGETDRANQVRKQGREEALAALLGFLAEHPEASFNEIGKAVGRSKTWAIAETNGLTAAGKLHRNGQGWEVRN
jgi:hypothetical protein